MNVFAGNITPDNEHAVEEMLETVALEALPGYDDLKHDDIDIQATFNISKGCDLAPAEVRFEYKYDGNHFQNTVDLVAKAVGVSEDTEDGYVDISNCQKIRYVIERVYA